MGVIVIGGGHNGLVAAATLARAGKRVTLLERRGEVGGVCDLLMDGLGFSPDVAKELGLSEGLEAAPIAVNSSGRQLNLAGPIDDPGYAPWKAWVDSVKPALATQLDGPAPDIGNTAPLMPLARAGLAVRRLGRKDMMELLRSAPSCVDDWLTEHMSDDLLKAALMMPALQGTWMGPRSPTSAASLLLLHATRRGAGRAPWTVGKDLRAVCEAAGVEIQCGADVARIRVVDGAVVGVQLADGTDIDGAAVLSAVGPKKTLLNLLDPRVVPGKLAHQADIIRVRGTLARVTLQGAVDWPGPWVRVVDDPTHLEKAFDDVKHRRLPTVNPPLEVLINRDTAHVNVWSAPYELDGGWTDEAKTALTDAVMKSLAAAIPGSDALTVLRVQSPADLSEEYGLDGGHPMHGELALDQLGPMRPSMQLSRYTTPISGLYMGSAGVHPGGGISGRPGLLAAKAVLGR